MIRSEFESSNRKTLEGAYQHFSMTGTDWREKSGSDTGKRLFD